MFSRSVTSCVFAVLGTLFTPASPANCYYPNGDIETSHSACNESADVSACCNPGDLCLSNGYCFQQFGAWADRVARGSCTDSTWESNSCPYYCSDGRLSSERILTQLAVQTFTGVSLYLAWENVSTLSSGFCCLNAYDISTNSCQTESHGTNTPFSLDAGATIYYRTDGSTTLPSNLIASITVTNGTSTITVTVGVTANHTDIVTVAASIAVPLGILLLLATTSAIVFWRKYKHMKKQDEQQISTDAQTQPQINMLQGHPAPLAYNPTPQELG